MNLPAIPVVALCAAVAICGMLSSRAYSAGHADRYASIRVLSPASGATVFDNNGIVAVEIELSPTLDVTAGHRIRVRLDDAVLAPDRTQFQFQLENVDRGEHWLRIEIVDTVGNTLITATPVKFHVWRAAVLLPDQKSRRHPL